MRHTSIIQASLLLVACPIGAGAQVFFVNRGGASAWPDPWTSRELGKVHPDVLTQLREELEIDEPELLATLNRLSPELRSAVLYDARFVGYDQRVRPLYALSDTARGSSEIEERLGARVRGEFRIEGGQVSYAASSLIVRCDEGLADRLRELPLGQPAFEIDGREFLLGRLFGTEDGPTYASVAPVSEPEWGTLPAPSETGRLVAQVDVDWVGSDYVYRMQEGQAGGFRPNDEHFAGSEQWALWAIRAPSAWNHVHASPAVVAVIDTGIDSEHEDLKDNLWSAGASYGLDLTPGASDPLDPIDEHGHGTHIAGVIGAVGNNNDGIAGVAWQVEILPIKIATDQLYITDAVSLVSQAVNEAVQNGADVINLSWVLVKDDPSSREAFEKARDAGVVIVTASGGPSDQEAYPAAYDYENVISVMGVDSAYQPFERSLLKKEDVDLAAPAQSIYSTIPSVLPSAILSSADDGPYASYDGVSLATALVSGAVALLKGHPDYASMTPGQLKQVLLDGVRPLESLSNECVSGGVLDLGFVSEPTQHVSVLWDVVSGDLDFPNSNAATGKIVVPGTTVEVSLVICENDLKAEIRGRDGGPITVYGKLLTPTELKVVGYW